MNSKLTIKIYKRKACYIVENYEEHDLVKIGFTKNLSDSETMIVPKYSLSDPSSERKDHIMTNLLQNALVCEF